MTTTGISTASVSEWTIREQLILASAVQRSGDQNWVSVSRAVKPLVEDVHPADYFSQKNCALQYSAMLDKAGTPKRKRSSEGAPEAVETAEQQIVRQLTEKRINELNESLMKTKEEYHALKKEIEQLEKGELDDNIPAMWEQMNAELAAKEAAEKSESTSVSLKLKSPPPSSNLAKYQAQLKLRKIMSPPPQQVPMELSSPTTSPSPIATPSPKGEISPVVRKPDETLGFEKMGTSQPPKTTSPSKPARVVNLPPLKLYQGPAAKKDLPSTSPGSTPSSASIFSPFPRSLSATITPKEDTLGGVPLQATCPSTEGNLQLSTDMHIIVQQPNTAVMEASDVKMASPLTKEPPGPMVSPVASSAPPLKVTPPILVKTTPPTAVATPPTIVTTTPAVSTAPTSTVLPITVATTVTVAQVTTPTPTPTTAKLTTSSTAKIATPITEALPSPNAPAMQPSSSTELKVAPHVVQPTPSPTTTSAKLPSKVVESPATATQPSPKVEIVGPPPTTTQPSTPVQSSPPASTELPSTPPEPPPVVVQSPPNIEPKVAQSPLKDMESSHNVAQPSPQTVPPSPTAGEPSAKLDQPSSKASEVVPSSPKVDKPPSKIHKVSSSVDKPSPRVSQPSPRADKPLPKVAQPSPGVEKPSPKVVQPSPKVDKDSHKVDKPSPEEDLPSSEETQPTSSKIEEVSAVPQPPSQPSSKTPPSSSKPEPTAAVVTTSVSSPTSLLPPATSTPAPKPTVTSSSSLTIPHPVTPSLISTHTTTTPSPLVTTAMKAPPPASSTVRTPEEEKASPTEVAEVQNKEGGKPKTPTSEKGNKSVAKKEEKEKKALVSEEHIPRKPRKKSPSVESKKTTPEKKLSHEPPDAKLSKKVSTPVSSRRSPSVSPTTGAKSSAAAPSAKSPKSPPASKRVKESTISPKSPKESAKEKREEKKEEGSKKEEDKKEELSSPKARPKPKVKEVSTPVAQTPDKERDVAASPAIVVSTPRQEKEGEPSEIETDETPIKVTRTMKKTPQRKPTRKRKIEDEGQSVESTDTEEDILSSAQTSAVPSPSPSLSGEMDAEAIQAHKQWKKAIMLVWRHAAQHKYANLFLHPVREEEAPGYKDLILRPMDLSTIKKKIESGLIKTDMEFQRDMLLMFQNAFMYNSSDHDVFFMAQSMKSDVMENIQAYLATQAQLQLMGAEPVPQKTLRSRDSSRRTAERDLYDESLFSPAKKRRLKVDD